MVLRSICTRVASVAAGALMASAAQATFSQCTTPLPGAGNCTFVTKGVGGCTNEACCRAICGLQEECCTEFWSLDCVVTAGSLPECAVVTKCPVTCPVGGLTEAEPCGDNTNGGCNSTPPAFPQTLTNGQTVCGTAWIAEVSAGNRDTDWYKVVVASNSRIEWQVQYEGARVTALIIHDPGAECGDIAAGELAIVGGGTFLDACNAKAVACVAPGTYYVFVAHAFSPADGSAGPFEVPCSSDDKDYRATLTLVPGSPLCTVEACSGGASTLTQSVSQTIVAASSVACADPGPPQTTTDNSFARSFNLAVGPTAGQSIAIKCVEVAIEANTGDSLTTAKVRIWRDTNGGAPAIADLVLLGEDTVVIPAGTSLSFVRANFSPSVNPPANSTILVEIFIPDTTDAGLSPAGGIWPGSNSEGQTGPTYILSVPCAVEEWADLASIGFPAQHNVMNVKYDLAGLPCPTDINSNGCTNGADIACILGIWTGAGTYPGCTVGVGPFHPADLNQDCRRNGLDVAIVLGSWGPCPGGACPGPTLPCP